MFAFGLARNSSANYFSINGASTTAAASATNVLGAWAHAEITIDLSNKLVSYKITSLDGNTTYYNGSNIEFTDASAATCNQIDFFDCQNNAVSYMDNLVITKYVDNSKVSTTYTVKYQNASGTDLKDPVSYDTYVDDTYTASSADMETFYNSDSSKKYIYNSGNESKTAKENASENVITLVFNEYSKVAYTITAKNDEEVLGELASGDAYTDGSTTVYWNKFKQFGDQWYETTGSYGKTITEEGNTDVAFTPSTITYFVESENIHKSRSAAANAKGTQYSGGETQRHYSSSQWWTDAFEEGGYFKVYFPYSMANASPSTLKIKTRDAEGVLTETGLELTANYAGAFSGFVSIPAGSSLAICNDATYNSNILIDYVALTKINTMSIIGDFSENGWVTESGIPMTQSTENPAIWTAVVENFVVSPSKMNYEYKAVANGSYKDYELPSGDNQNYAFGYDGAREGVYKLTFTANLTENTVELAIERTDNYTYSVTFVNNSNWEDVYAWAWNGDVNYTGGTWPGQKLEKTGTYNIYDVYTFSVKAATSPASIIFNAGDGKPQTATLGFEDGKQYSDGDITLQLTAKFVNVKDWDEANVKAYTFTGDNAGSLGGWPGTAMTKTEDKVNGHDVYTITINSVTAPEGIIFSNDGSEQTCDLTFEDAKLYSFTKEISAVKYATYCSPYPTDFSVVSGLKAYIAKLEGTTVKFYEVTDAPANTGILLKNDVAGTYSLYTPKTTLTDATGNVLIGVNAETKVPAGSFVLMNGSEGVGFYKTTQEFTVGANTAYIEALPTTARFIGFNFDETTGIDGIAAEKVSNGEVYNLQGQRVMNAKKGLYIMNGKKVLVK